MAIIKVQADLFFGLFTLVNFHLIFGVFSFRLVVLLLRKDAWSIALFHRDRVTFTSSWSSSSSPTSIIETSESDFVRSMADMMDNEGVVYESEKSAMAGINTRWVSNGNTGQRDPAHRRWVERESRGREKEIKEIRDEGG